MLASLGDDGAVHLDYMTSERQLLSIAPEEGQPLGQVALGPRGDVLAGLDAAGTLRVWRIDGGCPEISWNTLFGKVFYEGYESPEYAWQTTGGEDFEPKFSLVPLVFGTLKGTFYAMLFAGPLALFGAAYVSYFTTPGFRRMIKPLVEIMATVPSVVIGFLIALWLAPILERWILAFFVSLVTVPAVFVGFMVLWQAGAAAGLGQAGGKRLRIPGLAAGAGGGRGRGRLAGRPVGSVALPRQLPPVAFRRAAGHETTTSGTASSSPSAWALRSSRSSSRSPRIRSRTCPTT